MEKDINQQSIGEELDDFEIEPLTDEALELVAGGKSSDGPSCCSCKNCSLC